MLFALELDTTNRIKNISLKMADTSEQSVIVDNIPDGNCADYLYINNAYVYDPLPPTPSDFDRLDAQVTYTAMMTDTLLPEETDDV